MVDFSIVESALKISWIQRIRQNSGAKWKVLPEHLLRHLGGCSFLLSCHYDVNLLQVNNLHPFQLSVLRYWQDYRSLWSDNFTQIHNQIIWNNSNIVINQKQFSLNIVIRTESFACVTYLMLISPFLSLERFQQKFQVQVPFTTYYGLINYIPSSWRRELKATNSTNTKYNCPQVCSNKRVSIGLTVNRQMAKKLTVNSQKGNIFTVNRQLSQPLLTVKRHRYPLLRTKMESSYAVSKRSV